MDKPKVPSGKAFAYSENLQLHNLAMGLSKRHIGFCQDCQVCFSIMSRQSSDNLKKLPNSHWQLKTTIYDRCEHAYEVIKLHSDNTAETT
eukprot:2487781-Amphidinium_carterae.1